MAAKHVLVSSGSPYEEPIGFSRAVRCGDVICVGGTAPIGPGGETVGPGDLYLQTRRCLEIIRAAVERAGGSIEDVVRTRVFLSDVSRWQEAARAHGEVFSGIRPASTFVEAKGFIQPDWLVEIEADCVVEHPGPRSSRPARKASPARKRSPAGERSAARKKSRARRRADR